MIRTDQDLSNTSKSDLRQIKVPGISVINHWPLVRLSTLAFRRTVPSFCALSFLWSRASRSSIMKGYAFQLKRCVAAVKILK